VNAKKQSRNHNGLFQHYLCVQSTCGHSNVTRNCRLDILKLQRNSTPNTHKASTKSLSVIRNIYTVYTTILWLKTMLTNIQNIWYNYWRNGLFDFFPIINSPCPLLPPNLGSCLTNCHQTLPYFQWWPRFIEIWGLIFSQNLATQTHQLW